LESKKQFVRYVSHEMRTPLNTVSVGIQLVDKYLQTLDSDLQNLISMTNSPSLNRNHSFLMAFQSMRDHCLHDLKGMVDDISLSCASSIDILNDLLVYDQVEEGHLLLKQRYVKILDCLQNISKPFQLQATEAGIHFSFLGSKLSTHVMEGNGIEREIEGGRGGDDDGDDDADIGEIIVCVDPFKIAQVIRNLLSNAFKYTSQGGSVSVNARVVTKDDTPVGVLLPPSSCLVLLLIPFSLYLSGNELFCSD
jgi:signal transduction histidine kinase